MGRYDAFGFSGGAGGIKNHGSAIEGDRRQGGIILGDVVDG